MTTNGLIVLTLIGYGVTLWITYEILKVAIKDAWKELKAAERKAVNQQAITTEAKVQD